MLAQLAQNAVACPVGKLAVSIAYDGFTAVEPRKGCPNGGCSQLWRNTRRHEIIHGWHGSTLSQPYKCPGHQHCWQGPAHLTYLQNHTNELQGRESEC